MIMADVLSILLLILGAMLVFNAYWLASVALAPLLVDRCRQNYSRPFRMTGLGLLLALPFAAAAFFFTRLNHPVGNIAAFASVGVPIVLGLAGSAGFAMRIGSGLFGRAAQVEPWQQVLPGGLVFTLTMLLPFIGWFAILPCTLVSGLGAAAAALVQLRKERLATPAGHPSNLSRPSGHDERETAEEPERVAPVSITSART